MIDVRCDSSGIANVAVERDINGRQLTFTWKGNGDLSDSEIYWRTAPGDIELYGQMVEKAAFITRNKTTFTINDPNPGARVYFLIKERDGSAVTVAERKLPLQGVCNFRDLGGYKTIDGKTVKWGKLYRSDELSKLSKDDVDYLVNLGLKTIIDFRIPYEFAKYPNVGIPGAARISLQPLSYLGLEELDKLLAGPPGKAIADYYTKLIIDLGAQKAFSEMLKYLSQASSFPMVMHCTSGKDRTGIALAIVLLALGLPEQTVIDDYMLSGRYREIAHRQIIEVMRSKSILDTEYKCKVFKSILATVPEYMEEAFGVIKKQFGSMDAYLETGLGLTEQSREALRQLLLEDGCGKETAG